MEAMYLDDLTNATEVVLDQRLAMRRDDGRTGPQASGGGGSAGRAAAGLLRIGNAVGAAVTNHRHLEPVENRIMLVAAIVLAIVGGLVAVFPRLIAYPIAAVAIWFAVALFYRSVRLRRAANREAIASPSDSPAA
jgi:cardiolipin synthase A/B